MMYDSYDGDSTWMTVMMPLVWLSIVGLVVLVGLVVYLTGRQPRHAAGEPGPSAPESHRETPEQILDRRFASGEIDAETHAASRRQLQEHAH